MKALAPAVTKLSSNVNRKLNSEMQKQLKVLHPFPFPSIQPTHRICHYHLSSSIYVLHVVKPDAPTIVSRGAGGGMGQGVASFRFNSMMTNNNVSHQISIRQTLIALE